jgi:zinc and cadmium transporter
MLASTFKTLLATLTISIFSFIGIFTVSLNENKLHKILLILVAYSAGTILGAALFDLLPEAVELVDEHLVFPIIAFGFIFFLLLERFLYWYHGHGHTHEIDKTARVREDIPTKSFAYLNLIGDFIHNFIDGMIIAAGFVNGVGIGITTSIAVAFHELPQEMGDYGILVYAGIQKKRALILNYAAAFSIVLGGLFGSFFLGMIEALSGWMIAFSAGAFIFLSASELIPEMHEEQNRWKNLMQIFVLILGVLTIYSLGIIFPHE